MYLRRAGALPALGLLSAVITETPAVLASGVTTTPADAPVARLPPEGGHTAPASPTASNDPSSRTHDRSTDVLTRSLPDAGVVPSQGLPLSNGNFMEGTPSQVEPSIPDAPAPSIGPQAQPLEQAHLDVNDGDAGAQHSQQQDQVVDEGPSDAPRRAPVGPAMPPPELLAAAAEVAEQVQDSVHFA